MKRKYKIISKITAMQIMVILILTILLTLLLPNNSQAVTYYNQTVKSGIENFPEGYKPILENLKNIYPNATFEAYYTGISWDDLIAEETAVHTRNTIKSSNSSYKCSCGKVVSGGYACASEEIIKYYIDPRNFLNEVNIFQFLEISYNSSVHTLEGVQSAVKNTFLDSNVTFSRNGKTQTMSYAQIILEAAKQSNMSPYSILAKIIQEVSSQGSNSVTGTYPGYEGYYNFYNYGAYDSGNAIVDALIYAKNNGWNNQYDSIIEGAKLLANSYTNAGQNTAYFYKWDVVGTSILKAGNSQTVSSSYLFAHQYMTNIEDPTNQSKRLYNTYAQNDLLDKPLNFIIPIYEDQSNTSNKLPSEIDSNNPNAYYVNDSDGINVRSEPSLSGSKIASICKDTIVLIQSRKFTEADGYSWDKIQLSNGVVGYAASEYLSPCSGKEVTNTANNKYEIKDKTINMVPGATIDEVKKKYPNATGEIKTGSNITIDGVSYTVVVKGDVDGDGKVTAVDALKVLKKSANTYELNGAYLLAGDIDKDGKITAVDALKALKNSTGTYTISL